jgi:hypothetical protein
MNIQGLTIKEIADMLAIDSRAVIQRLRKVGIQPSTHAGKTNIYDPSVVEQIREVSKGGRPRKAAVPVPEAPRRSKVRLVKPVNPSPDLFS